MQSETYINKDGTSNFSFIQFEDKKNDFNIIIKIDALYKNKATAAFNYNKNDGDCGPFEAMMLTKEY